VGDHANAERQQNQRRILFPGPRGNIYDRHGKLLVGNRASFAVQLHLDELKTELEKEHIRIRKNYRATGDKDLPTRDELREISRVTLVQRYLDQVNHLLGREEKVDTVTLQRHFRSRLLLPFTLIENLEPAEYSRLWERLPVNSPLEVSPVHVRSYPYKASATHVLGYVRPTPQVEAEDFPGDDLHTFPMKGSSGRDGLERWFDSTLEGQPGGRIYRVDPAGYKINPPLASRTPVQGKHLFTSLDIELQQIAEDALGDQTGAAVAIEVATGEVLVMASMPNYDLNSWYPKMTTENYQAIQAKGAEMNYAINARYPPGSTFKILSSIAAMRNGALTPDQPIIDCDGVLRKYNGRFVCYNGREHHHEILLREAIALSCDIYFYEAGWRTTPERIAAEARRFHLDQRTGVELPENTRSIIPDPEWKRNRRGEPWYAGDTANVAIGQGDLLVTPLQMACFVASVARGQVLTKPTLVHQPGRPPLQSEALGLTAEQRTALLDGMEGCVTHGTAKLLNSVEATRIPGINILGKTGTAQVPGRKNVAWFIAFAPREKPEVAIAVAIEGETAGEEFGGGRHAAPVAAAVLKKYFEKKNQSPTPSPLVTRLKSP
jgi:penicillin-binding protein 2